MLVIEADVKKRTPFIHVWTVTANYLHAAETQKRVTDPVLVRFTDGISVLAMLLLNLSFHQPQLPQANTTHDVSTSVATGQTCVE